MGGRSLWRGCGGPGGTERAREEKGRMKMRREIERKKKVEKMKQVGTMKWRWTGYSQPLAEEEEGGLKRLKGLLGLEGFLCEQSRSSSALQRMGSGLPPRLDRTLVVINMLIIDHD